MSYLKNVEYVLIIILSMQSCLNAKFNVIEYGANPNGKSDSTKAFINAWKKACDSTQQATLYVPKGNFLVNEIKMNGPCKNSPIIFIIDGIIVSPDYGSLLNASVWIEFNKISGIDIRGGVLDGRGQRIWDCKNTGKKCPDGVVTLKIDKSDHVNITGLTSKDSQQFHIHIFNSEHINLHALNIMAPQHSINTDGIHVSLSNNVHIIGSNIGTGDDCISIGEGTRDLWIENVNCGPGHGISIGSLGQKSDEKGVENITVTNCTFTETQNGLRIKTWPQKNEGFVKEVIFRHNIMNNTKNPIIIDQHYCNKKEKYCQGPESGVKISNISYINIQGTSTTELSVNFNCSKTNPCKDIYMETIDIHNGKSSCANAFGTSSNMVTPTSCLSKYIDF